MRRRFMTPIVSGGVMANVGDIAYKATDGSIKVVAPDAWNSALGAVIGVVVIPSGFAPDNGLPRIVALAEYNVKWLTKSADASRTNYLVLPTTDNTDFNATGSSSKGYLPSDKLSGATSFVDPKAKYGGYTPYIPSPYLGDKPNPVYYAPMTGGNALSDFNGKGNTDKLYALGSQYQAANAARNYKVTGAKEIEWYLPAAGELGHLIPRLTIISASIVKAGGTSLSIPCWSSTEYSDANAYGLGIVNCNEWDFAKTRTDFVARPFATLDSFTRGKAVCRIKYWLELGFSDGTGDWYSYIIESEYPVASNVSFVFKYKDKNGAIFSKSNTIASGKITANVVIPAGTTVIEITDITPSEDTTYSYVYGEW